MRGLRARPGGDRVESMKMDIVDYYCPDCRARLRLDRARWAGRPLRCPECGCAFRVPTDSSDFLVPGGGALTALPPDSRSARLDSTAEAADDRASRAQKIPRPAPSSTEAGRFVLGCVVGLLLLVGLVLGGFALASWWMFAPLTYPPQTEDYVQARRHFHTHLTFRGLSPQQPDRPEPSDPRAIQIGYASGHLPLRAWVSREAAGDVRKPAVIYLHCGFAYGDQDWFDAEPFRAKGYIVMTPLLRGENGLHGAYSMLYDEVDDVLAATETLAAMPGVDPYRIYLAGHSNGGSLALLAAMCSRRYRAAASFSGSCDQHEWARQNVTFRDFDPLWVRFNIQDKREFQMRSPVAFARSFKCPVRMYYALHDKVEHLEQGCWKTVELARQARLDVQAESVPGDQESALPEEIHRAIAFFQERR